MSRYYELNDRQWSALRKLARHGGWVAAGAMNRVHWRSLEVLENKGLAKRRFTLSRDVSRTYDWKITPRGYRALEDII